MNKYVTQISQVFRSMDTLLLNHCQITAYRPDVSILFVYVDTINAQMKLAIIDFNPSRSCSQILEEIDGMLLFAFHSVIDSRDIQSYRNLVDRIQIYFRTRKALLDQMVGHYRSMVYNVYQSGF
ncbi:hypothetical protein IWQ61_004943 [Dispira simplex]|nr:hypothetical protein IWQ61_004943 [Dispira simplex]